MKYLAVLGLAFGLVACGGDDGGSSDTQTTTTTTKLLISGDGSTRSINDPDNATKIIMSGSGNTLNISSAIDGLTLSGSNNLISFSADSSYTGKCLINGNDNTIEKPADMSITCTESGLGNQFIDL